MHLRMRRYVCFAALVCALLLSAAEGFILCKRHHQLLHCSTRQRNKSNITCVTATASLGDVSRSNKSESGECYYKRLDGSWKPRKELSELFVGERLFATRQPEFDLLHGVTGPKVFLECGVGRKKKGNWNIVNAMLRIPGKTGKNGMKPSERRKKVKKIPTDSLFKVYVSKVTLEHGSFEVCLNREDALSNNKKKKFSASSLAPGEQFSGVVRDVLPYGVFVDIGANRKGLIHISKVAQSQDRYIDKEKGLKNAGLSKGSSVEVVVVSNDKKRLELDLHVAKEESIPEESDGVDESSTIASKISEVDEETLASAAYNNEPSISAEEADMWAAYAAYENDANDGQDDYYDEDEEIEDALGIGSY